MAARARVGVHSGLEIVGHPELVMRLRFAVSVALLLLVTGCAAPTEEEGKATTAGDESGWHDDLARLREQATTELERQILADDRVTEEERAAAENAFVTCAARAGFIVTEFERGGGYTIDGPFTDDGPPALRECEGSFNRTSGQYWLMQRNPSGTNEVDLMIACLVRAGVIDESFTPADYMEALGEPPLSVGSAEFGRCNADPVKAFAD